MTQRFFSRPRALVAAVLVAIALAYQVFSASPAHSFSFLVDSEARVASETQEAVSPEPTVVPGPVPLALVSPRDSARFQELRALLESIPTGREALADMDRYRVRVEFRPGAGTAYLGHQDLMVIDSRESPIGSLFCLVHEMTHASRRHRGMWVDPQAVSRDEYINHWVEEEAEGEARAVQAKLELQELGVLTAEQASPLEGQYLRAFRSAAAFATARSVASTGQEPASLAREAGKSAIVQGFLQGLVVTSIDGETYATWYGRHWDEVNLVGQAG